jgi:thiol:disulfide interchange protein DsbA
MPNQACPGLSVVAACISNELPVAVINLRKRSDMRIPFALAVVASVFLSLSSFAAKPQSTPVYREGVHYHVLPEQVDVDDPGKVEVTEVFWYGCSHCYHFEPRVIEWSKNKPEDVNFVQIPAMWNSLMEAHARAFYVAKQLGIKEDVHQAIYNALNIDRKRLDTAESIAELFAEYGADKQEVIRLFKSADATTYLKQVDSRARAYQITGTPQIIVHGRYRIEASQQVPQSEMFKVVNFLVDKVRTEKSAAQ